VIQHSDHLFAIWRSGCLREGWHTTWVNSLLQRELELMLWLADLLGEFFRSNNSRKLPKRREEEESRKAGKQER